MNIKPLFDNVLVKRCEAEEKTKGGIILPGSAQEKPEVVEVIEVGPGGEVDGKKVEMTVNPKDKVIISKYAGTDIKIDGQEYILIRMYDIKAIVK